MKPRTENILITLFTLHLIAVISIAVSVYSIGNHLIGIRNRLGDIDLTVEEELPNIKEAIYGANKGVEDKLMDIWGRLR